MQSDEAGLLMEADLNGDIGTFFKRIEIYQELRQTDRRGGVGRAEGGIHSTDGCWNYKTQHTGCFILFTKMASCLTCCFSKE
jgi:hypothetical protein